MAAQVDIIIPTFNRSELTLRAVQSVLEQSTPSWRLLIVDDASTDGSVGLLRKALPADDRCVLIAGEVNRSAPGVRQWALDRYVEADWVALLDSDDEWMPHKLERQLELAAASPDAGVVLCWHEWRRDSEERPAVRKPDVSPERPPSPTATSNMSTPLIRRGVLDAADGFTPGGLALPTCDNIDLYLRLSRVARFACVPELLVTCWHASDTRVSTANSSREGADQLRTLVERERGYLSTHPDELSDLEIKTACRLLEAGELRDGRRYLRAGLTRQPSKMQATRRGARLAPFLTKVHLRRLRVGA